jgi:hypothetical protein
MESLHCRLYGIITLQAIRHHYTAGYTASLHCRLYGIITLQAIRHHYTAGYDKKERFFQEQLDSNNGMGHSVLKINTAYECTTAAQ